MVIQMANPIGGVDTMARAARALGWKGRSIYKEPYFIKAPPMNAEIVSFPVVDITFSCDEGAPNAMCDFLENQ